MNMSFISEYNNKKVLQRAINYLLYYLEQEDTIWVLRKKDFKN